MNAPRVLTVAAIVVHGAAATAQTVVGGGLDWFWEDSEIRGEEQVSVQDTDQSFDYRTANHVSAGAWCLTPVGTRVRAGGGLRHLFVYAGRIGNGEDVDRYELGKLLELNGRIEWILPAVAPVEVLLAAELGPALLFPDGDFQDEIDALRAEGAGVRRGLRVGGFVLPQIGLRYQVHEGAWLRLDAGAAVERLILFNRSAEVGGIAFSRNWTGRIVRYQIRLAFELGVGRGTSP